jgi:hypothetical protein
MPKRATWTWLLLFPVLVSITGCGTPGVVAGADPLHAHLFCGVADGQTLTCEGQFRLAHLTSWIKEALHRPGSTFSIWAVGPDRSSSSRFFGACIPDHWSAPVSKSKKAFLERARAGAGGSKAGLTEPAGCQPPGPKTPGRNQLVVSPDVSPLAGDVWQQVTTGSASAPLHHSAIVCDRSESTAGAVCTPGTLLRVFDRFIADGRLLPGSSLSVEMIGPLRDALQAAYDLRVPDLPVGERVAFVLGGRSELARLFGGPVEQYASAIVEAISAAVRRLRERRGTYRLYLFSDMRQISGPLNFEKSIPAPHVFLTWLKKQRLATDLKDIPLLVCGMRTGHFGLNSAANATRLHDLWKAAFQSQGAPEVSLFSSCEAAFAAYNPGRNQS